MKVKDLIKHLADCEPYDEVYLSVDGVFKPIETVDKPGAFSSSGTVKLS